MNEDLLSALRKTAPHVAFAVTVTPDPDVMLPGTAQPHNIEVSASCILEGELLRTAERADGWPLRQGQDALDDEIGGRLCGILRATATDLLGTVGHLHPPVSDELDRAIEFLKAEGGIRWKLRQGGTDGA